MKYFLKSDFKKYLQNQEERLQKEGEYISYNDCGRHIGNEVNHQDICPCEARIYYS